MSGPNRMLLGGMLMLAALTVVIVLLASHPELLPQAGPQLEACQRHNPPWLTAECHRR